MLEEEVLRGEPVLDGSRLATLSVPKGHQLRTALQAYARTPGPLGLAGTGGSPDCLLSKPAFCRFLLDSRLLQGAGERAGRPRPYHEAARLFDALARKPAGRNTSAPSVVPAATIDQAVLLVRHLLVLHVSPEEAEAFFMIGLPEAQQIVEALLEKYEDCVQAAKALPSSSPPSPRHNVKFNKDPPPHFHGSVKEWSQGMVFWERTVEEQGDNAVQRVEQQYALASYIGDMLVDPGSLYMCFEFADLFKDMFNCYADSERTFQSVPDGAVRVKHMSFPEFFRFCVDFSVFPKLCSFDEARSSYASAECLTNPGEPEPERGALASRQSSRDEAQATTQAAQAATGPRLVRTRSKGSGRSRSKRLVAAPISLRAGSEDEARPGEGQGGPGGPKGGPRSPKGPPSRSPSRKGTKSFSVRDTALATRAMNLAWVRKDFVDMSGPEQRAYRLLSTIHEASADRFMSVRALFAQAGVPSDRERESSGCIGVEELLAALRRWRVEHRLDDGELQGFVDLLSPGHGPGGMKLLDLEKAVHLVQADQQRRRPRFLDPRSSRNPISNLAALGHEARRLDDEDAQGVGERHPAPAFGPAAFMEALLRLGFRHLHGSGVELQAAMPPGHKGLWLLAFLHFQFDRQLQAHRASRSAPPKAVERHFRRNSVRKTLPPILLEQLQLGAPRPVSRSATARDPTGLRLEEVQQEDVQYSSCLARLLDAHPNLFQRHLGDARAGACEVREGLETGSEPCAVCGRCRSFRGVGSPMCHGCSGVDSQVLFSNPLYSVIERRQLFREIVEPRGP